MDPRFQNLDKRPSCELAYMKHAVGAIALRQLEMTLLTVDERRGTNERFVGICLLQAGLSFSTHPNTSCCLLGHVVT